VRKLLALVPIPLLLVAACGGGGSSSSGLGGGGGGGGGGGLTCTAETATDAEQVSNPVSLFANDSNGVIIELPSVPSGGALTVSGGVMVFGIGTETNNTLGGSNATQLAAQNGEFTANFNTSTLTSYLDSGSNANFFADSSVTTCASPESGFYCPAATETLNATLIGSDGATMVVTKFNVENALTLFMTNNTAFNDVAGPPPSSASNGSLDLGLPYFFGTNIFTGFEDPATGATPYFAVGSTQPGVSAAANVEPLTVDAGPAGLSTPSFNTAFVSVKVCVPGSTTSCQTIDHIEVDTGSVGLRLISSVVTVSLPALNDASNQPLAECLQFADGTTWGSLVTADITLPTSGKSAKGVVVQLIGAAAAGSPPSACTGTPQNTLDTFGANGILGVGPFLNDCVTNGDCPPGPQSANYYSCSG